MGQFGDGEDVGVVQGHDLDWFCSDIRRLNCSRYEKVLMLLIAADGRAPRSLHPFSSRTLRWTRCDVLRVGG